MTLLQKIKEHVSNVSYNAGKFTGMALDTAARLTKKPVNIIVRYNKTFTFVSIVLASTIINSYYRPIQENIHQGIIWVSEQNETVGDFLYEANGFVFNGKAFDNERKAKFNIYSSFNHVVTVTTMGANPALGGGRGTGWFYEVTDAHALVVTNHHVIDAALNDESMKLTVHTAMDMWDYPVEVIGYDEVSDIAVLKISKQDDESWEAMQIADPEQIGMGDPVVIVGHGMGQAYTATQGTVTYKDRYGSRPYNLMLQVDAVINQGNSGGPVTNLDGEVVGVAQSILSPGRQIPGWDGIGMAVSVEQFTRSIDYILSSQYKTNQYVPYAEFPFSLGTRSLEEVKDVDREDRHYVYVDYSEQKETNTKTVGELAGLQQGDTIVSINGKNIRSSFVILKMTINAFPGDTWKVVVLRDGKEVEVDVTLREMEHKKLTDALRRGR